MLGTLDSIWQASNVRNRLGSAFSALLIAFTLVTLTAQAKEAPPKFSQKTCEALLRALDVDDITHANISLPPTLSLDFTRDQFNQFFHLSLQLWENGFERKITKDLLDKIAGGEAVTKAEIQQLKDIRARLKHLRFSFALYDDSHRYPKFVDAFATALGDMQDGYKNGRKDVMSKYAGKASGMLKKENWSEFDDEISQFSASSPSAFRKYLYDENDFLLEKLKQKTVTAREFHKIRKVISRLVSLLDTVQALNPKPGTQRAIEYLATINGEMGRAHDGLKAEELDDSRDYGNDVFKLPTKLRKHLATVADRLSPE